MASALPTAARTSPLARSSPLEAREYAPARAVSLEGDGVQLRFRPPAWALASAT